MRRGTWGYVAALLIAASATGAQAQQDGATDKPAAEPPAGERKGTAPGAHEGEDARIEGNGDGGGFRPPASAVPEPNPAPSPSASPSPSEAQVTPPDSAPDVAQPGVAGDAAPGEARQNGAREDGARDEPAPAERLAPGTGFGAPAAPAGNGGGRPGAAAPQARRPIRFPGGPQAQADAWRQLLSPAVDTAERAQIAAENLAAAEVALGAGDAEAALGPLQLATQTLEAIYEQAPGAQLASGLAEYAAQLSQTDAPPPDLAPLVMQVEAMRAVLPAEVVTQVQDAQRQVRSGDRTAAARSLLGARTLVFSDFELLPVEAAFARSRAALAELEAGNTAVARNLIQGVPASISEVRTAAPLVPVRLRLRAAAGEANERNWVEAEVLLNEAAAELEQMRLQASPALARRIDPLSARVAVLQERIAAGTQPSPARFRQLAEAAGGVPAG